MELSHPTGLLQSLPILERKWESVSMDFIMRLLVAQGRDCIYVVVDRLTKFSHFFTISSKSSASQVVELFFEKSSNYMVFPKPLLVTRIAS